MIKEIIEKSKSNERVTAEQIAYLEEKGWLLAYSQENSKRHIFITQDPYLGDECGRPVYKAAAVDFAGNEYEITWELRNGWENMEDASEHCYWEDYSVDELM